MGLLDWPRGPVLVPYPIPGRLRPSRGEAPAPWALPSPPSAALGARAMLRPAKKHRETKRRGGGGPAGPLGAPPPLPSPLAARSTGSRTRRPDPGRGRGPGSAIRRHPLPGSLREGLPPSPGPVPVIGALRFPGRPAGSGPGWRRYPPPRRHLPHSDCLRGAIQSPWRR